MAPLPPRRRVSYGIPPPSSTIPIPRLWLPPLGFDRQGSVNPILISNSTQHPEPALHPSKDNELRHRLGVSALALDTTTQLVGRPSPEGILYTGARDGLVIAWDLHIPMRKRTYNDHVTQHSSTHWELLTGWVDPVIDDAPGEDQEFRSDGDIIGDVRGSARRRELSSSTSTSGTIPFEHQWETDAGAFRPGQPSTFRQAAQIHSDWVNDILLCNQNQTLVSASSDGTVKAWSPHSSLLSDPVTVGTHADYVRCIAYSREQGWVASGSFDRTIKLWDLSRASQTGTAQPLMTLSPPEASGAKTSIYALAADPQGHTIVSGGPERVIRMWDPRAGKRIGKLVGHTDNIRAILLSEDSRFLLTASADASIKLWSLTTQRCLHTFTHHTDSVWALHSSHPSLEIFYSGDKSGFVAKIDVEGCAQISEGECALVCQDVAPPAEGVTKLIALDDTLVWTASGSSSLRRWRAPSRRAVRAAAALVEPPASAASHTSSRLRSSRSTDLRPRSITLDLPPSPPPHRLSRHTSSLSAASPPNLEPPLPISALDDGTGEGETTTWFGLPFDSLVHLASPLSDPFTPFSPVYRGRSAGADADVATLYSAASLMSVSPRPLMLRSPLRGIFPTSSSPPQSPPSIGRPVSPAHSDFAPSSGGLGGSGNGGGGASGGFGGGFGPHRAAFESREVVADAQPLSPVPEFVLVGGSGLVRAILLSNRVHALTVDTAGVVAVWDIVRAVCVGQFAQEDVLLAANAHNRSNYGSGRRGSPSYPEGEEMYVCSPREALDIVRERIDGEAFVVSWSYVDTSMGVLNVNLDEHAFDAELYADELGLPPDRVIPVGIFPEDLRINLGKWILRNLFLGFIHEEEQAHLRRLRSGAMSPTRTTGSIPLATSPPLPLPHSPQEPPTTTTIADVTMSASAKAMGTSTVVVVARNMLPALTPIHSVGLGIPQVSLPQTQPSQNPAVASPTAVLSVSGGGESTTQASQPAQGVTGTGAPHPLQRGQTEVLTTAAPPTTSVASPKDDSAAPTRRPSVSSGGARAAPAPAPVMPDESGSGTGSGVNTGNGNGASGNGLATPGTPGGGIIGKLRGFGRATKRAQNENAPGTPAPAARATGPTATGLGLGPASSTVAITVTPTPTSIAPSSTPHTSQEFPAKPRTAAQIVLSSGMLSPPTTADGPSLLLAQDIPLLIAEERAPGWAIVYRGTVARAGTTGDVAALEDAIPVWLLEYLLLGRTPQVAVVKIQFALLPGEESLPELVNPNQTKLSASRFLRIRKLAAHVQERIEALGVGVSGSATPQHASPRSSLDPAHNQNQSRSSQTTHTGPQVAAAAVLHEQQKRSPPGHLHHTRPDELWEIVCNDTVLLPNVTLAVVRQHVWRQSGEVVLYYRRKRLGTYGKG